jgi:ubiquinone/menaquinone biosynthesis C-methylase UbiE
MNRWHRRFCASAAWAGFVRASLVPAVLSGLNSGDDVLEVGPGPGLTTDALIPQVRRLTVIEIDEVLSSTLSRRFADTGVAVVTGDATKMPFQEGRFSAAVCFTMLHHVPTPILQDRLLSEVHRVLRPGGLFAGSDSSGRGIQFRLMHLFDTMTPVDPATLSDRLRAAGFHTVQVGSEPRTQFRAVA